ncbi:tol protein [Grosmannia clavigera kw1407]|uniref:Tol protein n=1 Tax=Grosmannia clavigera (strain kw1407 / UAMH 11150) TaxID=655863 RepID=F0XU64_GROCL|nr:tol protein [Grosmannia clavigera kw1407]EFW99014.1 tol protein [Grosmannia clavigera kw1407]
MKNCFENHTACGTPDSKPYAPKRFIDVRNDRVVLRENVKVARYDCLSHCWGPSQSPIKTLKSTLADFQSEIPWAQLSKMFQDAVDICRRLDIDYLWLDSLCIIQDSDGDWKEQSVLMADIYQNALITIAAAKAGDGSAGCYSQRDPGYLDLRTVVLGRVYTRKCAPSSRRLNDLPLLRRGWVLQEMLLSTRVVYYMHQEVAWQCRSCYESENGNTEYPVDKWMGPLELIHKKVPRVESWHQLISTYSALQLTFDKDRLAALASISERFDKGATEKGATDSQFLAGLWQPTLLQDMVWLVGDQSTSGQADKRPEHWRENGVPSWSWEAVRTKDKPYLGKFTRSDITLRGPLLPCHLDDLEATMHQRLTNGKEAFLFDDTIRVTLFSPDYGYNEAGPDQLENDSAVFLLPLIIVTVGHHQVKSLVLRRRSDRSDTTYERIGLAVLAYIKGKSYLSKRGVDSHNYHVRSSFQDNDILWTNEYLSSLPAVEITIT